MTKGILNTEVIATGQQLADGYTYFLATSHMHIYDSTYRKVPVVRRLDYELHSWMQSKNISKYVPKVDFQISH